MTCLVSITRLRLRSWRYLLPFLSTTRGSIAQVRRAEGFRSGSLLADLPWTFWTGTVWDSEDSMRRYMGSGDHRAAMPLLLEWCDEASVVHWEQADADLPSWADADRRMRRNGRPSRLRHPSRAHGDLAYAPPRTGLHRPIRREAGAPSIGRGAGR